MTPKRRRSHPWGRRPEPKPPQQTPLRVLKWYWKPVFFCLDIIATVVLIAGIIFVVRSLNWTGVGVIDRDAVAVENFLILLILPAALPVLTLAFFSSLAWLVCRLGNLLFCKRQETPKTPQVKYHESLSLTLRYGGAESRSSAARKRGDDGAPRL